MDIAYRDPDFFLYRGLVHFDRGHMLRCRISFKIASLLGSGGADAFLGSMYFDGDFDPSGKPDFKRAYPYLKCYAEYNHAGSLWKLAQMYRDGLYVRQNETLYRRLLLRLWDILKSDGNDIATIFPEAAPDILKALQLENRTEDVIQVRELMAVITVPTRPAITP